MKRKQKFLSIRKTANLTSNMRKEREEEVFEVTSPSPSLLTLSSEKSKSSESTRKSAEPISSRIVRVRKEKVIVFDADLASLCEFTCDTHSMNSILELEEDMEGKPETHNFKPLQQLVVMKYVITSSNDEGTYPIRASVVSEALLCEVMSDPKTVLSQAKAIEGQEAQDNPDPGKCPQEASLFEKAPESPKNGGVTGFFQTIKKSFGFH